MTGDTQQHYGIDPHLLEAVLSGQSLIDLPLLALPLENEEAAKNFLFHYGYNLQNPIERAELMGRFHEALHFVKHHFLYPDNIEGLKLKIPSSIIQLEKIEHLFLRQHTAEEQIWACCLLKIVHILSHIDREISNAHFTDIQQQIFDRFYKHLLRTEDEKLFLSPSPESLIKIPLVSFESKLKKSRESLILKMIQKTDHATESIFDKVGVRLITHSLFDGLRVLSYLFDQHIIIPINIKPSRSKNTLIDLKKWKPIYFKFLKKYHKKKITEEQFLMALNHQTSLLKKPSFFENPHSSQMYHAIQITATTLITIKNESFQQFTEIKNFETMETTPEEIRKKIKTLDLSQLSKETRFFYPFEVQILDEQNAIDSKEGESAHSLYKKSQKAAALRKLMKEFIKK